MRRLRAAAVVLVAHGVLASGAFGQGLDGEDTTGELLGLLLADLAADELAQREAAQAVIATLDPSVLGLIERELMSRELDPEAAARLAVASAEVFARAPHGAMGIRFGGELERGVLIQAPVGGDFDSATKLEPNDIITAAGGREMRSQMDLRVEIVSRLPGETLAVTVMRDDRLIEMDIVLGDLTDLGASRLDPETAMRAWETRVRRLGIEHAWLGGVFDLADGASLDRSLERPPTDVVAGGQLAPDISLGVPMRRISAQDRQRILNERRPNEDPFSRPQLLRDLARLQSQHEALRASIASTMERLESDLLDEQSSTNARRQVEQNRARMTDLEQQMAGIRDTLLGRD